MVLGSEIDWDLYDEDNDDFELDDIQNDNETLEIDDDDQVHEPLLVAAFQNAQRSLHQARNAIKRARMTRGFKPQHVQGNKFRKPGSHGPNPSHGNFRSFPPRNNFRPSQSSITTGNTSLCVVCGGGHHISTCPDRMAPAHSVDAYSSFPNQSFTFMLMAMDDEDQSSTVPTGNTTTVPNGNLSTIPTGNSPNIPNETATTVPTDNLTTVPTGNNTSVSTAPDTNTNRQWTQT